MPKMVYQLKVTLQDIEPLIWRRIQVPSTYTFWELHSAIQDSFAWNHSHQHQFRVKDKNTKTEIIFGTLTDEDIIDEIITLPEWKAKVSEYLNHLCHKMIYIYDFCDDWEHTIELEDVLPAKQDVIYPRCLKGKRNSPPDDCGGAWGYDDMLRVLANPEYKQYKKTRELVESMKGGPFHSEHFDPKEVVFEDPVVILKKSFE